MKNILFFMIAGIFFASCSDNVVSDIVSEDSTETRATADNPFILTSPLDLNFNDTIRNEQQTVNVKLAGIPSLAVLTSFSYTIQGEDAQYFSVLDFDLSLEEYMQALFGGGFDIPVSFYPTAPGDYEAELLINTSLFGVLLPMQETVSLYGSYDPTPIELISSSPAVGGTSVFYEDDPDTVNEDGNIEQGYYNITLTFNQDILLGYNFFVGGTASLDGRPRVSGNVITMRVRDRYASRGLLTPIRFLGGCITSKKTGYGNQEFTYEYTVGERPDSY